MTDLRKTQTHGRIGEAAVTAKCWMHGIAAHNTNGLRANFAGSDLLIDTADPRRKRLVQVKTGYSPDPDQIYLTQATGTNDLTQDKLKADFVVFVNIDRKIGTKHNHDGSLGFEHLTYFVVPVDEANRIFKEAVHREHAKPLRSGGVRSLNNLAVNVSFGSMSAYKDAWHLIRVD